MSLTAYNKKRNFSDTAEPEGKKKAAQAKQLAFVIQRHKASRLHYDFRLEMDGVLKSWAVPKGPSLNPGDKRLAMMVEDHPFDYKDFEGIIPEGNYGAGIVEIWDKGTYTSISDDEGVNHEKLLKQGLKSGNLKFTLNGKKLKGEFALVKLKSDEDNSWLLIKHKDKYAVDEAYNSEEHTPKTSKINKWLAENKPGSVAAKAKPSPVKKKSSR
jgi:bifunctional non-homologous end joining protein LigD